MGTICLRTISIVVIKILIENFTKCVGSGSFCTCRNAPNLQLHITD